jgi:hypothetical protein
LFNYNVTFDETFQLKDSLSKKIEAEIERLLERLYRGLGDEDEDSVSVYTGMGGEPRFNI